MGARVNKLTIAGEIALVSKRMGKSSLVISGIRCRIHGENSKLISWAFVKDKRGECKGKLNTNLQYEIFRKMDHFCVSKLAGMGGGG